MKIRFFILIRLHKKIIYFNFLRKNYASKHNVCFEWKNFHKKLCEELNRKVRAGKGLDR